jgi:hypothetical protein
MAHSIGEARAGDGSFPFVSVGGLLSVGPHEDETGLLVGAEVSAGWFTRFADDDHNHAGDGFRFDMPAWIGAYGDVVYDSGTGVGRATFGPEVGFLFFGIDGGLARELGGSDRWGAAVRLSVTFPVSLTPPMTLSLYGRGVKWNDAPEEDQELGLLLKYALPFSRRR